MGRAVWLHCWGTRFKELGFGVVYLQESLSGFLPHFCRHAELVLGEAAHCQPPNALARLTPHPPCEAGVSESSRLGQRFCILLSSEEFSGRKQNPPPVEMQPLISLYKVFFQICWVVRRQVPLCFDPLS